MWNKFARWYWDHGVKISWFLIGFMLSNGLTALAVGDYFRAIWSFGIAALNYFLARDNFSKGW